MTSTPEHDRPAIDDPRADAGAAAEATSAGAGAARPRSVQDDPRAKLALARKNSAASPAAATGAGHVKAATTSSKQGRKEKKVRW